MNSVENNDQFLIGLAKEDITPAANGEVLLGFGDPEHKANKIETPLFARALTIELTKDTHIAIACLEICFISQALRDEVLSLLQTKDPTTNWNEAQLLLCATHTHCAPGGHTHDIMYNLPNKGWYPHVLKKYAEGTMKAILKARRDLKPGRVRFAEGEFKPEQPVAFNRSVDAWNLNPETQKYSFSDRHKALDKTMRLFRFENLNGEFIGCLNEFAVHCTSVHRDYKMIHSDNKGIAATELENKLGGTCIFVQGAAGDVSPNFQKFKGLFETRGTNKDDLISVRDNGLMQSEMAEALVYKAKSSEALAAELEYTLQYINMSNIEVDPQDVNGQVNLKTRLAVIGARALLGTDEGMPTPKPLYYLIVLIGRMLNLTGIDEMQKPKLGCVQSGEGQIFKVEKFDRLLVPGIFDPIVQQIKKWGALNLTVLPLSPQIVPIQLLRLGSWVWLAVPGELTTTSGARLKKSILSDLKKNKSVQSALIVGYANSFTGYITTPEEYELQRYEGASTHFGKWTQPAYQTVFRKLALNLGVDQKNKFGEKPQLRPKHELDLLIAPDLKN